MTKTGRRVGLATRKWVAPAQTSKLKVLKCIDKVNLATRKLGQEDLTRQKMKRTLSDAGKLDAASPKKENMRLYDHQYMDKIYNAYRRNWRDLR